MYSSFKKTKQELDMLTSSLRIILKVYLNQQKIVDKTQK